MIYNTNNTFEMRLCYLVNLIVKVFNSLLSYSGWVTCVVYVVKIKQQKDIKMKVWLETSTYKKKLIMYKLMGNRRL